jgi:hypothetical protein
MAFVYKTLGQQAPSTTNNVDIYTVPASTEVIVSSILICNTTSTAATFRIFQRIEGATAGTANAIAYDQSIPANSTTSIESKITMNAADVLTVRSGTANSLTFTVNGSEIVA